jgi:hypothetical protein
MARLRRPRSALVLLVASLSSGCGPAAPSAGSTSSPAATSSAPVAVTPAVPTLPPDAAPPALQGEWSATLAPGDTVSLRLGQTTYAIHRGGFSGGGHISVTDDEIQFSGNPGCPDTGTYRWVISDGGLTFNPVGSPDPCPRIEVLIGPIYEHQ